MERVGALDDIITAAEDKAEADTYIRVGAQGYSCVRATNSVLLGLAVVVLATVSNTAQYERGVNWSSEREIYLYCCCCIFIFDDDSKVMGIFITFV